MPASAPGFERPMWPALNLGKPTVLFAEDHAMVAAGIAKLLENRFQIIGTPVNGRELVQLALERKPDLIVVDISMPLLNGIEATRQICRTTPNARIVVLTQQTGKEYVQAALQAGEIGRAHV